jgi:spore germination cell wall hydrolase CwlJ-like protein
MAKKHRMKVEAARQWRRRQRRRLFIFGGIGAAVLFLIIGAAILLSQSGSQPFEIARSNKPSALSRSVTVKLNIPPPDLLRPISPEEALAENSKREFSERPDSAAAAFTLKADSTSRERALECLTQAVYYEAAGDGADGERAVAQVVLNRMRHPAYPASVCGVVYQGSDRPVGCQFTFTCDGSLARIPIPALWKQAQRIASQALAGKVFAPVGHSTHYHADYVLPYWADSLDKSVQIGRHIFYRLTGGLGAINAFRQRYSGAEPLPPSPTTVEVALDAVQNAGPMLSGPTVEDPLRVSAGDLITSGEPKPQLVADALQGTLLVDGEPSAPPTSSKPTSKTTQGCPDDGAKRMKALSSNDLRVQGTGAGC